MYNLEILLIKFIQDINHKDFIFLNNKHNNLNIQFKKKI